MIFKAVSAGHMFMITVGTDNRWEFMIAGSAVSQLEQAVEDSKAGDVVCVHSC